MEELNQWRKIIRDLLHEYAQQKPSIGDIRIELICDEQLDHYELMYSGWVNDHRIHGPVVHIDIHGGKVWVERDGTSDGVVDRLLEAGIPKDKIVLAFKHPDIRPHRFAVA